MGSFFEEVVLRVHIRRRRHLDEAFVVLQGLFYRHRRIYVELPHLYITLAPLVFSETPVFLLVKLGLVLHLNLLSP